MSVRVLVLIVFAALAGCAPDEPKLLQAAANSEKTGPDEFSIVTNRPLQEPASYAALPAPTPGSANLADEDPAALAAEALGGRAPRVAGLASGSPLLSYVSRYGFDPAIRQRLAQEDLAFRQKNRGRIMERLFASNVYFDAYRVMTLDRYAELERMRRLGIATPAAPPSPTK